MGSLVQLGEERAEGTAEAKALRQDPAGLGKEAPWPVREAGQMWLAAWTEAAGWGGLWLFFSARGAGREAVLAERRLLG